MATNRTSGCGREGGSYGIGGPSMAPVHRPTRPPPRVHLGFEDDDVDGDGGRDSNMDLDYGSGDAHAGPSQARDSSSTLSRHYTGRNAPRRPDWMSDQRSEPQRQRHTSHAESGHDRDYGQSVYREREYSREHDRYRRDNERQGGHLRNRDRDLDQPREREFGGRPSEHRLESGTREREEQQQRMALVKASKPSDTLPVTKSVSPEPDAAVLAYIESQKAKDARSTTLTKSESKLAEQLKMERFQHGASKIKSRPQREREEAERKRREAEEEAAKAYADFVAHMGGTEDASEGRDGQRPSKKVQEFVAAGGKAYAGSRQPPMSTSPSKSGSSTTEVASAKRPLNAFGDDSDEDAASEDVKRDTMATESSSRGMPPSGKRKRAAMDSFLTELQSQQAERESRLSAIASSSGTSISSLLAHEGLKTGSRDLASDPLTTNICIPCLPAGVDESSMGEFFRGWGDVATVKIMWPRGEPRERAGGLLGFVAYMTRDDAEYAFKNLDGATWGGVRLKLSWSKAVPIPSRALYSMSIDAQRQRQEVEEREHGNNAVADAGSSIVLGRQSRIAAQGQSRVPHLVIRHRRLSKDSSRESNPAAELVRKRISTEHPDTHRLFIETVASRIRAHGPHFEAVLRERESGSPRFSFLNDEASVSYQYFRMCLDPSYVPTVGLGDTEMFEDAGSDALYSTDSGEESENRQLEKVRRSDRLGTLSRKRLCSMLRGITLRRERIARITALAMDHARSHAEVVGILVSSVLQPTTPIPRKLARLYCLSDILHNSGCPTPHAWQYRAAIELHLPLLFAHLGQIIDSFEARLKREAIKAQIKQLLGAWESWLVVSPPVMERIRKLLDHPPPRPKMEAVHASAEPQSKEDIDGEDLDGEAMDDVPTSFDETKAAGSASQVAQTAAAGKERDASSVVEEEDLDGEAM